MLLKRLSFLLLALALSATVAYGWRWQQAQEAASTWVSALRPVGILRAAQIWPRWNAHEIVMEDISFEPTGAWQQWIGAPIGYQLRARRLVLTQTKNGTVELRAFGVRAPLLNGYATPEFIRTLLGQPAPDLANDLHINELRFDAGLTARQQAERLQFTLQMDAPDLLRLYWDAQLRLPQADWQQARWSVAGVDAQRIEIADLGYFTAAKEILAARARTDTSGYEQLTQERLRQMAESGRWRWSEGSARAAEEFIAKPAYLEARMNPFSTVQLSNLGLYAPGDLFQLFALELRNAGQFDHPALTSPDH